MALVKAEPYLMNHLIAGAHRSHIKGKDCVANVPFHAKAGVIYLNPYLIPLLKLTLMIS